MKKLRKRLFAVIGTLVCAAIMISVIFNIYFVNSQKIFREQAYAGSLKVYMQSIEDSLTDIENMLAIESRSDGNLKMIIRSSNRLEWYLALVRKKNQFETEIKKYQYLDGIFLYDSRKDLFAGVKGTFATEEDHTKIKDQAEELTEHFKEAESGNEWLSVRLGEDYYLIRMQEIKGIYLCAWIKPEHLTDGLRRTEEDNVFLCDSYGNILNRTEKNQAEKIGEVKESLGSGESVFSQASGEHPYTLFMIKKDSFLSNMHKTALGQVAIILCLGGISLFAIWSFTREILLEPLNTIFLEKELEKNKAELHFLQVQTNPHFLNNCLSLIRSFLMFHQYEAAEKAALLLSHYSRRSLRSDTLITVREELEHIDDYYHLQQMRLDRKLRLEIFMETGLEKEKIPFMLLYTFVENAIKHSDGQRGEISVAVDGEYITEAGSKKKKMRFQIVDNGEGFDRKVLDRIKQGRPVTDETGMEHIGISNVIQRLQIIYGEEAQIAFDNEEGAVVTLEIPVKREEDIEDEKQMDAGLVSSVGGSRFRRNHMCRGPERRKGKTESGHSVFRGVTERHLSGGDRGE